MIIKESGDIGGREKHYHVYKVAEAVREDDTKVNVLQIIDTVTLEDLRNRKARLEEELIDINEKLVGVEKVINDKEIRVVR